jgi:signal transduction histidine kinase
VQQRQVHQVFQNLVGNSLKYSKPGRAPEINITCKKIRGKEAGIRLTSAEMQKEYHLIEVRDNGTGFEQEDAERVFNVFQRLHEHTEQQGTGLGLAIVKKIIENHDGHVAAEGKPGVGATFKLLFPVI